MDLKKYWQEKHIKYSNQEWIDKPTIFAKFAIKYFPKGGKILELGAGQGQDSRFFAENGFDVVSTDFSNEALNIAKSKTNKKLKIDYQLLNIEDRFSFENNSFDVVYAHMSIHYFDNNITQKIFDEIFRVLKNGGTLSLLLNSMTDPEVKVSKIISEDLYETPSGINKRFFSTGSLSKFVEGKFKTIVLDSNGETYKDEIKTLIRFIGNKI